MAKRVVYRNILDGKLRVLISNLTDEETEGVMRTYGNPKDPFFYMGPETRVEECDGTADGTVLEVR